VTNAKKVLSKPAAKKKVPPAKKTAPTRVVKKVGAAKPVKKPVKKVAPAKPVKKPVKKVAAAKPIKKVAPPKPTPRVVVAKPAPVKAVKKAAPVPVKAAKKVAPPKPAKAPAPSLPVAPARLVMLPSARPAKRKNGPQLKPLRNIPEPLVVSAGVDPWTKAELNAIRRDLQTDLDRLRLELASAEVEIADLLKDSGDGAGDDQADAGTKTFEREHELSLVNNARDMVLQSERALARIEIGTYGVCESCGNPIGKARLQVFPRATLCMVCKQREERR
jgi:DnaK suppressor protein